MIYTAMGSSVEIVRSISENEIVVRFPDGILAKRLISQLKADEGMAEILAVIASLQVEAK
jgi:hypothetical protein